MKRSFACVMVLATLALPAFTAGHSQKVTVLDAVTVAGAKLPAGDYKVTWSGSGPAVQITLKQQGVRTPASATVQAKVVEQNNSRSSLTTEVKGGVNTLEVIHLDHFNLVVTPGPNSGE